ncbi:hypothetical protein Bhyg_11667 [Pseudolycoriella hygida]|uniref:Uncharacterized protein n=1 Tax=Pseudolycoriella hygida TaxID=35572 RepID=A0A9Q0MXA5_9DIPT|nr:hypothetical protein Bhyg_11667 [Pseudolycoriella hygida]
MLETLQVHKTVTPKKTVCHDHILNNAEQRLTAERAVDKTSASASPNKLPAMDACVCMVKVQDQNRNN